MSIHIAPDGYPSWLKPFLSSCWPFVIRHWLNCLDLLRSSLPIPAHQSEAPSSKPNKKYYKQKNMSIHKG